MNTKDIRTSSDPDLAGSLNLDYRTTSKEKTTEDLLTEVKAKYVALRRG